MKNTYQALLVFSIVFAAISAAPFAVSAHVQGGNVEPQYRAVIDFSIAACEKNSIEDGIVSEQWNDTEYAVFVSRPDVYRFCSEQILHGQLIEESQNTD